MRVLESCVGLAPDGLADRPIVAVDRGEGERFFDVAEGDRFGGEGVRCFLDPGLPGSWEAHSRYREMH